MAAKFPGCLLLLLLTLKVSVGFPKNLQQRSLSSCLFRAHGDTGRGREGVKVRFPREKVRRSGCVHWRHGLGLGPSGTKPGAHHPLGFPLLFQQGVHGPAERQMLISECRAEPCQQQVLFEPVLYWQVRQPHSLMKVLAFVPDFLSLLHPTLQLFSSLCPVCLLCCFLVLCAPHAIAFHCLTLSCFSFKK